MIATASASETSTNTASICRHPSPFAACHVWLPAKDGSGGPAHNDRLVLTELRNDSAIASTLPTRGFWV